jgi:hypothetical protein
MEKKIKIFLYVLITFVLCYHTYQVYSIEKRIEKAEKEGKLKCKINGGN